MPGIDFQNERMKFEFEVEAEATRLLREGKAAPYDVFDIARRIVMERRRRDTTQEKT